MIDVVIAALPHLVTVVWHTLTIYGFLILCLVVLGRRELSQITFVELVVIMILGSAVETAMVAGNTNLDAGLISATTLLVANRVVSLILTRSKWLRQRVIGGPIVVVHDGRFVVKNLWRVGLTPADVESAARERGYSDLTQIRYGVLEVDGSVSIIPFDATDHRGTSTLPESLPS